MPALSKKRNTLAFYGAFCLFLSTVEFLIPKPLPFFRLGLANLPILLALAQARPLFILQLVGLKIVGQALVNGTLFSYIFVFSTAGSLASGLAMLAASRIPGRYISLIGISILGALASNLVQILLARYFLLGEGAWLIGPPFLGLGILTGCVLGYSATKIAPHLSFAFCKEPEELLDSEETTFH
ncbi:MAG: Gx transporter family protein, partial [Spirochaetales bacterium]